jgi:hypothetical protein
MPNVAPLRSLTPAPFVDERDRRWRERSTIFEVSSAAANTDKLAIGSSPALGDYSGTGLEVPFAPTTAQTNRYLFRLCGISIPFGKSVRIMGLRQLATIRAGFQDEHGLNTYYLEKEIVSPLWSFLDGNISWHLRLLNRAEQRSRGPGGPIVPGTSGDVYTGRDSALLYNQLLPYIAPGNGVVPGRAVPYLGTWRDMRFPWNDPGIELDTVVSGPSQVIMYASVHQTDPDTRYRLPAIADPGALRPEDRFLQAYPLNAVYGHVGGAFTVQTITG